MASKKNYNKFYMGIPGVRNANYKEPLEKWQVEEIVKCALDPIYFIEKYIKIISKTDDSVEHKKRKKKRLIDFILRPYQIDLINDYYKHNRFIIKFPRQAGKSAALQAICVHLVTFHEFKNVAVLANKDRSAKKFLGKIKMMLKNLPFWLQQGVKSWNKTEIEFDNESMVISPATSADGIRGDSVTDLIIDEAAFVDDNLWAEFYASVYPTVSADEDAKITIISTPNGLNHFYKFWTEAINKISTYIPMEIAWDDVPGRDEAFKNKTIGDVGKKMWNQEFCCIFAGSGDTLISTKGLLSLGITRPLEINDENSLRIFEYPQENATYVCVSDVGEGVGEDSSTIQVLKIETDIWPQAAVYQNNTISTDDFPIVIEQICKYYNEALSIGENNFYASVLSDLAQELEYENVFFDSKVDKHRYGIRMTTSSKKLGNAYLKKYIESGMLMLFDENTINELSTYAKKGNSYAASGDHHDDLVTPLVIFSYFIRNNEWVENWIDVDLNSIEKRLALQKRIEEDIMPVGFVNRGNGIEDLNEMDDDGYLSLF